MLPLCSESNSNKFLLDKLKRMCQRSRGFRLERLADLGACSHVQVPELATVGSILFILCLLSTFTELRWPKKVGELETYLSRTFFV